MVVATFSTICIAAVLFLLRFLFALESETRSARTRQSEVAEVYANRTRPGSQARNAAPALMLVHSNTSRQAATSRSIFTAGSIPRERNSQFRGA